MPRILSHKETLAEYEAAMGKELAAAYQTLFDDIVWLHFKWQQYFELFGVSAERVELLHEAANRFFGVVDGVFFEDTLLSLCRLTDRPEMGGKRNLTLWSLPQLITDPPLMDSVAEEVEAAKGATAFARDWRDRHIAHRDFHLALSPPPRARAHASRAAVDKALSAIERPIRTLHMHFFAADIDFALHGEVGDALTLLHVLRDGVEAARQRDGRFERGEPTPADLHPRPML